MVLLSERLSAERRGELLFSSTCKLGVRSVASLQIASHIWPNRRLVKESDDWHMQAPHHLSINAGLQLPANLGSEPINLSSPTERSAQQRRSLSTRMHGSLTAHSSLCIGSVTVT